MKLVCYDLMMWDFPHFQLRSVNSLYLSHKAMDQMAQIISVDDSVNSVL